jgi:hypothetical protein
MELVTAVIVTRGDVDLDPVLRSLPSEWSRVVWDNSKKKADMMVYGRYAPLRFEVETSHVYFQDDDVIVSDPLAIAAAWEPGHIVCNMPPAFRHDFYSDHALVGFGAVCETHLPEQAFSRFWAHPRATKVRQDLNPGGVVSDFFHRTCDVIVTALMPRILVDVPKENLPWATGESRMYRQPGHVGERQWMLKLARQVRDA